MRLPELPDLPVRAALPGIVETVRERGTAVLVAPPGTGKTTLVPLALGADSAGRVVVAEPRRLAARAAAARMAALLGEPVGATVGYSVRGERRVGAATRIEVVTSGLLVRRLQGDPELSGVDAVVLDECHERHLDADLLLALLLDARAGLRPDLRVLATSATVAADRLAVLLGADEAAAPVLEVRGRTYPVDVAYVPPLPRERAEAQVARVTRTALAAADGDVLVFLPGAAEIRRTADLLSGVDADIVPLHGRLAAAAQDTALRPGTRRRIVLSTAVAESSLTVPGVRAVVDSGLARVPRVDHRRGLSGLATVRVSAAVADQRAGRAGREAPGWAWRCWPEFEHTTLPTFPEPEIRTADLTRLALELASWGIPDGHGLAWWDAPPPGGLSAGREVLRALGAVDADGAITARGRRMATVGLHPRLARALLDGAALVGPRRAAEVVALLDDDTLATATDLASALRTLRRDRPTRWQREVHRLTRLLDHPGTPTDEPTSYAAATELSTEPPSPTATSDRAQEEAQPSAAHDPAAADPRAHPTHDLAKTTDTRAHQEGDHATAVADRAKMSGTRAPTTHGPATTAETQAHTAGVRTKSTDKQAHTARSTAKTADAQAHASVDIAKAADTHAHTAGDRARTADPHARAVDDRTKAPGVHADTVGDPARVAGMRARAVDDPAVVVALAHPERLARRRSAGSATYLTAGGTAMVLPPGSGLGDGEWLAVAVATRDPGRAEGRIRLAAMADAELARQAAPALLDTADEVDWVDGEVVARRVERLGAITLSARPLRDPDPGLLATAVRRGLREHGVGLLRWDADAHSLRARLDFLHRTLGAPWPAVDDDSLLDDMDRWLGPELDTARRRADLERVDAGQALRRLLPWPEAVRFDELAPERLEVPSGSAIRLDYSADPPVLAVKVQEIFGWTEPPRLADGRVPILLHLLSPAQRPVAVTADLPSFWRTGWPQVRADLRGRYPKHAWPEDPTTMPAHRGTARRAARG
ncbi:ATP-dependent helicase HrpB [Nocardia otitidiscaviarum]|uniref:ATP-dependent helicase C-terminal domain-containing protein n=1 Tax=Nocardia otitidiscaviarum TaxID=1823 RepID=UPI0018946F79|nr:ATP-dependent helicase C-terminal domain-containing protein [Nocardia otitidiscaviarum]MBF6239233.1 ATP-dependent helicase HrpB [Nocardia otitidiscaviarum]